MKIGNILALASSMLGNEELSLKIKTALSEDVNFTEEEAAEIKKLLSCYNITVSELNDEFFPLMQEEDMSSSSGKYYFADFTRQPVEIRSVCCDGREIPFRSYPLYITCDKREITVLYEYLLDSATSLTEAFPYQGTIITERIVAEGIVSEYSLIQGMYEHAVMWRDKYLSSLKSALLRRKVKNIRQRAWY